MSVNNNLSLLGDIRCNETIKAILYYNSMYTIVQQNVEVIIFAKLPLRTKKREILLYSNPFS